MDRRDFSKNLINAVASYALFRTLVARDAFGGEIRPVTDRWVRDLQEIAPLTGPDQCA